MHFEEQIRKFDTDIFGFCRASGVMNLAMDATLKGMEAQGFGRNTMLEEYGAVWMAAHFKYNLERPLFVEERVEINVSPLQCAGAHVLSRLTLSVAGKPLGRAVGAWIAADAAARKIRNPRSLRGMEGAEKAPRGEFMRRILPPETAAHFSRTVRYSDCDVNGHFNSPRYADCICDAHGMERLAPGYVAELQVSFAAESRPGETLDIRTWQADGCLLTFAACDGKARFSAYFVHKAHAPVR